MLTKNIYFFILVIFVLLPSAESQSYGCLVWRNSYLYFDNDNKSSILMTFYKSPRKGDFTIGFGNTTKVQDLTFLIHFTTSSLKFYTNHTLQNQTFNVTHYVDDSTYFTMDNVYYSYFLVPRRDFEAYRYVFFSEMDGNSHGTKGWKSSPLYDPKSNFNSGYCSPRYLLLPGRLFATWWYTCIPYTLFGILVIILCIYYRDYQPLKSRGEIGPILSMAVLIINNITEFFFVQVLSYEEGYYSVCFATTFLLYPTVIILTPIYLFYYLRFIIIVNVNTGLLKLSRSGVANSLNIFYKILLRITKVETFILYNLIIMILYLGFVFIVYGLFGFDCGNIGSTIIQLVYGVIIISTYVLIALMFVWDFFQNIKLIFRCKCKELFIKNDPFYFRLIFIFAPLTGAALILWILPIPYPSIIRITFVELAFLFGALVNSILPLGFTIISNGCQKRQNKSKSDEFLFETEEVYVMLLEFSKNEWSMENVICKKLIMSFKKTIMNKKKYVMEIYSQFLLGGLFELNIREKLRNELIEKINSAKNDVYPKELFDPLEEELQSNLKDIYGRFFLTDEFKSYLLKSDLIKSTENQ